MPTHPARARKFLKAGRAAVYRRYPFTIIMRDREGGETQDTQVKIDPGAQTTGLALVANFNPYRLILGMKDHVTPPLLN